MNSERIVWDNEEKSRQVEMVIDYTTDHGHLRVSGIRPITVTFYDGETRATKRTIGVHTKTGRRILRKQYLASCDGQSRLEDTIRQQRELRDELVIATAV